MKKLTMLVVTLMLGAGLAVAQTGSSGSTNSTPAKTTQTAKANNKKTSKKPAKKSSKKPASDSPAAK